MSNLVKIELMTEEHLDNVAKVFMTTFNAVGENWSYENARQNISENFFDDVHFVAKIDDKIVGFLMGIPLTREKGLEFFLSSIAILPKYQYQGIGKLLWEKMLSVAKEKKYVGIRLLTNPHLESYNWYKEMGFTESGWIEVFKELKF